MPQQTAPLYSDSDYTNIKYSSGWMGYQISEAAAEYGYGDYPEGQPGSQGDNVPSVHDVILMGYKGHKYTAHKFNPDDMVPLVTAGFDPTTVPREDDQQKAIGTMTTYMLSDITEYGIGDNVELPPSIIRGWDTDVEQQKSNYVMVPLQDIAECAMGDVIELPPAIIRSWDYEPETKWTGTTFSLDALMEIGIGDNIELPPAIVRGWDTDSENQKYWIPQFGQDNITDESTEKITLTFNDWSLDSEQQRAQATYDTDRDLLDSSVEIIILPASVAGMILMSYKGHKYKAHEQNPDDIVELVVTFDPATVPQGEDQQLYQSSLGIQDLPEYGIGDNPERLFITVDWNTDEHQKAIDVVPTQELMEYGLGDNIELPPAIVRGWDTDTENQKYWIPLFGQDTLLDEEVENIRIFNNWDTDSENQKYWLPLFSQDGLMDEEVEKITFYNVWDNDSEYQRLNPLSFGMDELSDSSVENIIIYNIWDNDVENQKQQLAPFGQDVLSDESVEKITLTFNDWTLDSEQQKLNPLPFGQDTLSDEGVEIIIFPIVVLTLTAFDNDAENQKYWLPLFGQDTLSDEVVENIIIYNVWDNDSENQRSMLPYVSDHLTDEGVERIVIYNDYTLDSDQQKYWIPLFGQDTLLDEATEKITFYNVWDNDSENQRLNPLPFGMDHLADEEVERIIIYNDYTLDSEQQKLWALPFGQDTLLDEGTEKIIIYSILDNDGENQRLMSPYISDHLLDEGVERIVIYNDYTLDAEQQKPYLLPFGQDTLSDEGVENIITFKDLTNDAENSLAQLGYTFDRNLTDENVESLQYASGVITGYDTDAENQKQHPEWYKDHLMDEEVEKITFPIVVLALTAFDTDTENQKYWLPLFGQDHLSDEEVEILLLPPAATGMVMMVYSGYRHKGYEQNPDDIVEIVIPTVPFELDGERQQYWALPFSKDDPNDNVELITLPPAVAGVTLMGYSGYRYPGRIQDPTDIVELLVLPVFDIDEQHMQQEWAKDIRDDIVELVVTTTEFMQFWDNDVENQLQSLGYAVEKELVDYGVERTVLNVGWDNAYDNLLQHVGYFRDMAEEFTILRIPFVPLESDSIDQRYWLLPFGQDDVETKEKETFLVLDRGVLSGWDNEAERQLLHIPMFSMDTLGYVESINTVVIPPVPWTELEMQFSTEVRFADVASDSGIEIENVTNIPTAYDTDAEQQFRQPDWNLDWEEEKEGVPYLAYAPGVITAWGWEIDNQIPTAPWTLDLQGWEYNDTYRQIFIIVPLFYRISTSPLVQYALISTMCLIANYVTHSDLLLAIDEVESETTVAIYKVYTDTLIGYTSVDTSIIEINRKK